MYSLFSKSIHNVARTNLIQHVKYDSLSHLLTRSNSNTLKPIPTRDELEKKFSIREMNDWYSVSARVFFLSLLPHNTGTRQLGWKNKLPRSSPLSFLHLSKLHLVTMEIQCDPTKLLDRCK